MTRVAGAYDVVVAGGGSAGAAAAIGAALQPDGQPDPRL